MRRFHVVLVPGFAGFDALGQLEYYGGVTSLFAPWIGGNEVLHYFDNFPTASVVTRATLLRDYLAKRIVRGEIAAHDEVTLVGHSTGGLDIRCLLWGLQQQLKKTIVVDGTPVRLEQVRDRIRRVVFLSVPHWGTNIADWVHDRPLLRMAVIAQLQLAVAGSQTLLLDWVERSIVGSAARFSRAGLFRAVEDALSEANEYNGQSSPMRTAEAHEAASELSLYLRQMASDFRAIDDLTACRPGSDRWESPAHFTVTDRKKEIAALQDIDFLSFATIGKRPFEFESGGRAPVWKPEEPWTGRDILKHTPLSAGTDVVYRICYRACAGGPFERPAQRCRLKSLLASDPLPPLELWDNDGIVNTLSMLWPRGENLLVSADHMDIVGQFKLLRANHGGGREYRVYDLLTSSSGFDDETFQRVWSKIFAFSMPRSNEPRLTA